MFKRKQYQMGSSAYTEAAKTNPTEKQPIQTGGNAGVGSLLGEMASSFVNSQAGKDILQGFSVAAGGPTNEQVDTFAYKVNENKKARDKGMDEPFPTPASDLTGIGGEGQTGPTAMQRWAERTRQPTQSVAMALQRMSSGVGAHPGGAGRGKGAGGSLGQEARQAMKRKRLSKRIANRKAKEDNDYAEGGRVDYKVGGLASLLIKENLRKGKFKDRPFTPFESEEEYLRRGWQNAEPISITSTKKGEGYWQTLNAEQEEALSIIEEALLEKRNADLKRKDKKFKSINEVTANLYAKELIRKTQRNPEFTGIEDLLNEVKKMKDEKDLLLRLGEARRRGDFAEGGRVGLYLGGLPKMFSKAILKKYSKDPKTKKLVEQIKEFETRIDEHKKIVAKQEQPEDVVKRLEKETGEPVYSSWQDLATEDMIELVYMENHLAKLYDDLLDIRDVNELQRIKNKSRSAYYDPDAMTDWEMEMGGSLGRKYTTPNFDEIDPADTVISEFYSKRKPKALGGILSNMSRKLLAKHKKDNVVKVLKKEVDKADKKLKEAREEFEISREEFYEDGTMEGYDFDPSGMELEILYETQMERQKLAFQLERRLYDLEKKENPGVEYFVTERDFMEDIDPKERRPGYIDRLEREMDPYNPDNFSTYWTPVADYIDDEPFKSPFAEGGNVDAQMAAMMGGATHTMPDGTVHPGATHEEYEQMLAEGQAEDMAQEGMVPDEQMEEDFVDYVVESTLEPEDTMYLEEALAADPRLSEIFDQVIETASEFSGSGPVEGPGSEVSDSIPARLSDGEFVITAKATEEIGPDNLQGMMEQAEMDADVRRAEAEGGYIDDDEDMAMIDPMQRTVNATEREMRKLQLAANPRTQYRTVYG